VTIFLFAVAAGLGAAVTHIWHKVRFQTVGNDLADYRAARHAPAVVTPPSEQDGGIVPARDVYRTADRYRRLLSRRDREIARLRQVTYDLYERLNGTPRPRRTLPARTVWHRRGWRDRARWFRPWPVAAITEADR
jgi:hypothetical protein